MKFLKANIVVRYQSSTMTTNSPYVAVVNTDYGFTLDLVLPWHVRLYRAAWTMTYPTSYYAAADMTNISVTNMGDVEFNTIYGGMSYKVSSSSWRYDCGYNDIPNDTVYNEAVTGGYLNRITISYYLYDGTPIHKSGYDGNIQLIFCFDDDDTTYNDMLTNFSPSSAISAVDADYEFAPRGYNHWYIKNNNTLPYLKAWGNLFPPPFSIYIGDDPVDKVYRGDREITTIYVGNTKI